jgi:hypothetical protein
MNRDQHGCYRQPPEQCGRTGSLTLSYQPEVMEKEVVYHGLSLLLGKNDDRLPDT